MEGKKLTYLCSREEGFGIGYLRPNNRTFLKLRLTRGSSCAGWWDSVWVHSVWWDWHASGKKIKENAKAACHSSMLNKQLKKKLIEMFTFTKL